MVVKSRSLQSLDEVRRAIPYRNTYMTPPPQKYEKE
jgi:hypothetical protein